MEPKANFYRRGTCARCALREDLTALMIDGANDPAAMAPIVEALCRVDRPASILTWNALPRVQTLLTGLACGDIPLTHEASMKPGMKKRPPSAQHARTRRSAACA